MPSPNEAIRPPGRPLQSMEVRDDLIHHARLLFIAHPYDKVSLRMVANNAGVNMGMIRYYFNNKAGLFETMLRDTISPMQQAIEETGNDPDAKFMLNMMTNIYKVMSKHKNFPRLIGRTMRLSKETLPRKIADKIMLEVLPILQGKIKDELNSEGVLQQGASVKLSYFSMINLMVFPFIAPPEILKMHGITIDNDFLTNLLEHNIRLLSQGIIN